METLVPTPSAPSASRPTPAYLMRPVSESKVAYEKRTGVAWSTKRTRAPGAGRQKGTPNYKTPVLREMILQALSEQPGGGVEYLKRMAVESQSVFGALIGRVLPMQVTGEDGGPVVIEIIRFGER